MDRRSAACWLGGLFSIAGLLACGAPDREVTPAVADASPAVADADLDTVLLAAVHEAGFPCGELIASTPMAGELSSWRILCNDAHVYLVEDQDSDMVVEPVPYGDLPRYPDGSERNRFNQLFLEQPQAPRDAPETD